MAKKFTVVVTGQKELDKALRRFGEDDNKGLRKAVRDASKNSISSTVVPDFKARVPVGEGVLRDTIKPKAMKRSRSKIGYTAHIDRDKLFKLYQKRYGKLPSNRKGDNEPFFYAAVVELVGDDKPLRKALYENENKIKSEFISELKKAIATAGRKI